MKEGTCSKKYIPSIVSSTCYILTLVTKGKLFAKLHQSLVVHITRKRNCVVKIFQNYPYTSWAIEMQRIKISGCVYTCIRRLCVCIIIFISKCTMSFLCCSYN